MALSSITFIFIFLPTFLLLFYILPFSNWRNGVLVVASLVFLGWVDPVHLPVLVALVIANYIFGRIIGNYANSDRKPSARPFMWAAVLINLLPLFFYKYTGFFVQSLSNLVNLDILYEPKALPLGISYFTFSGISYILDVYNRAEEAEKNLIRFSSYLMMFPKLLQGPITRFVQVKGNLLSPKFDPDRMMQGARRFIAGLAKKILLADSLGIITDRILSVDFTRLGVDLAWLALISYTLQIYLDFSGYTDMAIGLGKMIGFDLPENFNFPYISRSITDFWRRWHMTLTSWFRNYVFIPLEFARKREKFLRQQSNILIVFLLTGLWHGASWNFVIWGVYFGLILAVEASGFGRLLKKLPVFIQHFYAMGLIMLGWVFFRITAIGSWGSFLKALFGSNGWAADTTARSLSIIYYLPIPFIAILVCLPLFSTVEKRVENKMVWRVILDLIYIALFILSISSILSKGFNAFIYAQF